MSAWPDLCLTNDRTRTPAEWPFLTVDQLTQCTMTTTLRDACGHALDLNTYGDIYFLARAQYGEDHLYLQKLCTKLPVQGQISIDLVPEDLTKAGIFLGQFDLQLIDQPVTTAFIRCYLEVVESLHHKRGGPQALSLAEVRMIIYDRAPSDNFLLDQVEFSNAQIAWAIRRPIDLWNETPPPVGNYGDHNFPYRYQWANAAAGELMMMASRNYVRNHLQYQAGNLSVADKAKYKEYAEMGHQLVEEYKAWLLLEKRRINCQLAMGATSVPAFGPLQYYDRN